MEDISMHNSDEETNEIKIILKPMNVTSIHKKDVEISVNKD